MTDEDLKLQVPIVQRTNVGDYTPRSVPSGSSRAVGSSIRPDAHQVDGVYNELEHWYINYIEQYKNNLELYNQLLNNPYYIKNAGQYQPFWYEDLLGLSPTADERYRNQLKSDAVEWVASFVDKYNDRSYDSAQEQVARESSAGINVNLSGGQGITPGDSGVAPFAQKDAVLPVAESGAADAFSFLHSTVQTVVSSIEMAFGLASKFQGLEAGELSLLNQTVDTENKANGFLADLIARNFSPDTIKSFMSDSMSDEDYKTFLGQISLILEDKHLPRSFRRFWKRQTRSDGLFVGNTEVRSQLQSVLQNYYKGRYDFASILSQPFYSDDFTSMVSEISGYLRKYEVDYEKMLKDFDFDKYGVVDKETGLSQGELAGNANIAELRNQALQEQNEKIENQLWNDIFAAFAKRDTWWSNLLLLCSTIARSMARSAKMPSVHLGANYRNNTHDTRDVFLNN